MRLLKATIPSNCDIALHGDTHFGSANCADDSVDEMLAWVMEKPNRRFVHMGDAIEAITTDDKRYQHRDDDTPIPLLQCKSVVSRYRAARKRGLVWLLGNHEFTLHRFGNLAEHMANELGIPYGQWTTKLDLHDKHGRIGKIFLAHGVGHVLNSNAKDYEQRVANMKASVKMRLVHKAADCIVMGFGHTHKLLVVDPAQRLILTDDGEQLHHKYLGAGDGAADYIEPDRRWYVNTGSFLRTYALDDSSYAERAGYDPIELGFAIVKIRNRKVVGVEKVVVG